MKQLKLFLDTNTQPEPTRKEKVSVLVERMKERKIPDDAPIVISFGAGKNSTALLAIAIAYKIKIAAILFADTGNEHPATYAWIEEINQFIRDNKGGLTALIPEIEVVRYKQKPIKSRKKKRLQVYVSLGYWKNLELYSLEVQSVLIADVRQFTEYHSLGEQCLINESLPSKAFGTGVCSGQWKVKPIEKAIATRFPDTPMIRQWIGIHSGEQHRLLMANGTPKPLIDNLNKKQKLFMEYPLIEREINEESCQRLCLAVFNKIPPKSACWFCPSSSISKVRELKKTHPELFELGCYIEENAAKHLAEGGSTKGLGRTFAWRDIGNLTPLQLAAIEAEKAGKSCTCID